MRSEKFERRDHLEGSAARPGDAASLGKGGDEGSDSKDPGDLTGKSMTEGFDRDQARAELTRRATESQENRKASEVKPLPESDVKAADLKKGMDIEKEKE